MINVWKCCTDDEDEGEKKLVLWREKLDGAYCDEKSEGEVGLEHHIGAQYIMSINKGC
jgi:hypothetical protein